MITNEHGIVLFAGGGGGAVIAPGLPERFPDREISVIVPTGDSGGKTRILRDEYGGPASADAAKVAVALSGSQAVKNVLDIARFGPGTKPDDILRLNERLLRALPSGVDLNRAAAALEQAAEISRTLNKRPEGLHGHTYRNIVLTALRLYNNGDLTIATAEFCEWVSASARVIPATAEAHDVVLMDGSWGKNTEVREEGKIDNYSVEELDEAKVRLDLGPGERAPKSTLEARDAIARADLILIGPGSPITSLAPSTLPTGIRRSLQELRQRGGNIVAIANLCPEPQATPGLDLRQYVEFIGRHAIIPDSVIHNTGMLPDGHVPLMHDSSAYIGQVRVIGADLVSSKIIRPDVHDAIAALRTPVEHDKHAISNVLETEVLQTAA